MDPLILPIAGSTDAEKTASLHQQLATLGQSTFGYEWHAGEPLYHGHPTAGFFMRQGIHFHSDPE